MPSYIPFTFPGFPHIRCAFGTRHQGNISLEVGDAKDTVLANRIALQKDLGFSRWCELKQVHGCQMLCNPQTDALLGTEQEGDGLVTNETDAGLVIKTADCQPILMAHTSGAFIAAIHCGWKGNRQHFPQKAVAAFCKAYDLNPWDILAVRGPSLGPATSEFVNFYKEWGEEFADYFDPANQTMNLWQLTRDQLVQAGLYPANIFGLDMCTHDMQEWFFSYRRNKTCGRQVSVIWREETGGKA